MAINLSVNGKTVSLDAPHATPLLRILRDELLLIGTKPGCGVNHAAGGVNARVGVLRGDLGSASSRLRTTGYLQS